MRTKLVCLAFAAALCVAVQGQQPAQTPAPQPTQTPAPPPAGSQPQAGQQATPPGQQPAPGQQGAEDVDQQPLRIQANEVNLIFTVTDKHGHYVANLKQNDFALLDDQKTPEKVTSFRQQINLPLRVGIVIDASTSIRTRFQFEQQSAVEFLLQILKARSDRAFVMGFDVTPNVTADWTNNIDALETGINRLRPGGGTAMFDAVYTACKTKLLDVSRGQEPVRRAMILISDGDDNQSRAHLDEAIKMCQRAETIVYAISTNWTPSRGRGDQVLTQLAQDTGGQVFFPPSVEEMSNSFKNIEEELRSQYSLTYIPADFKPNGQFRPIYLYCTDRRYIARARKGYFAPKE